MNTKELLLALNLMAEKKETQYVLQYNYSFNNKTKRIYNRSLILKYYKTKLIHKIKVSGDPEIVSFVCNEMKLYA